MTHSPTLELAERRAAPAGAETPAARSASGRGARFRRRRFAAPDLPRDRQNAYRRYRRGSARRHGLARARPGAPPEPQRALAGGALGDRRRVNYGPDEDPLAALPDGRATISVYARHRDYHDLIKGRLKQLAGWMHGRFGAEVKVFVDTAPILEKPLAQQAGIGWQGGTPTWSRRFGSWLFLGEIFTDLALPPDPPESTTAAAAAPAWTSARPTRSRRRTSSTPGAASRISRSSTRGTYRGSSAP